MIKVITENKSNNQNKFNHCSCGFRALNIITSVTIFNSLNFIQNPEYNNGFCGEVRHLPLSLLNTLKGQFQSFKRILL